jgi:low affinity Fe/Cu permease
VLTFLAVFLIQNSQNRESKAIQLKLGELLRAVHDARDTLIDIEETTDDEIDELKRQFRDRALHLRHRGYAGRSRRGPGQRCAQMKLPLRALAIVSH